VELRRSLRETKVNNMSICRNLLIYYLFAGTGRINRFIPGFRR
jgi:hypothetical protein